MRFRDTRPTSVKSMIVSSRDGAGACNLRPIVGSNTPSGNIPCWLHCQRPVIPMEWVLFMTSIWACVNVIDFRAESNPLHSGLSMKIFNE